VGPVLPESGIAFESVNGRFAVGLAFDPTTQPVAENLHAVLELPPVESSDGPDTLVRFSRTGGGTSPDMNGTFSDLGRIELNPRMLSVSLSDEIPFGTSDVQAAQFTRAGHLIATSVANGNLVIIEIVLDSPESSYFRPGGDIDDDVLGLGASPDGVFHGIFNDVLNSVQQIFTGNPDQAFISSSEQT
ncbi:MAG: hypothetical protein QF735_13990, partial [Phycisphaeraceae bacterium]|nr:hypothetical protein [Phycisphaeraceae bacterium]